MHKELIVDSERYEKVTETLCAIKEFMDSEMKRFDDIAKNEPMSQERFLTLSGELFIIQKLMIFATPRLCEHENVEFGDIDERGECLKCHATCDWHREMEPDEDTGQEIENQVVDEWYLPTMEDCHKMVEQELGIKG